ncbi:AAA family ATPase [Paracraurococcus lichenis]|uniref:AAA family ATPase n=1 Tax=Paracraurococcus lichenis TaxID=3064888 RepID=A0ABT9E6R2_9PROT|nr:AAA family ATPase [Paracraurococcus sp. LOR1-02]MDO9711740.1 AAA family ATPase [Paracraurococcus sp. LOR1-02]
MRIDIYGFREPPFLMTPDARLFFPSTVHSRAYAHLMYGLAQGEGFVVVTGEVGAGKTTLIERLCAELDPATYVVGRIATTQVQGDDLLRLVADAFGAPAEGEKAAVLRGIMAALRGSPRRHVLIVDEAQALSHAALEELRMLSNVTDGNRALLQTILLGQPQLRRLIASPDLDQLRQRILASFHLGGLSEAEVRSYVEHRMRAVGWAGNPSWDEQAFAVLHRHTDGIPRRINRLCSRVLLAGALEQAPHLSASLVEMTAAELDEDLGAGAEGGMSAAASRGLPAGMVEQVEDLAQRVEALERSAARRERVLNRLMGLFAETGGDR